MWAGQRTIEELTRRSAWKVEFFAGDGHSESASLYPPIQLHELVRERRETIDPQSRPDFAFNYLSLENVQSLTGDLVSFAPKLGREILSRSKVFHPGDVLYARLRPKLNKVYLAEGEVAQGICSGEFYVLVPNTAKVIPLFLRTALSSELIHPLLADCQTGSALPRLRLHDLMEVKILLPPMEAQQELTQAISQATARRRELLREAHGLPRQMMTEFVAALEGAKEI